MRIKSNVPPERLVPRLVPDRLIDDDVWPSFPHAGDVVTPSSHWLGWQGAVKRALDIIVALLLLIALAPLLALITLAIRLDSPGPIIFRQPRCGKDGLTFTYYKFRSMVPDAPDRHAALRESNETSGPIFKMRRDPRVTRLGRWLRRSSLDELPQLWNVVRGDMSLVGPRPPLPAEVAQYGAWEHNRLLVRGGMTGLWQVSGRSNLSFRQMIQHDVSYIERWSLWLDLRILVRTVLAVAMMRGAY